MHWIRNFFAWCRGYLLSYVDAQKRATNRIAKAKRQAEEDVSEYRDIIRRLKNELQAVKDERDAVTKRIELVMESEQLARIDRQVDR